MLQAFETLRPDPPAPSAACSAHTVDALCSQAVTPDRVVCHCLRVTEGDLRGAIAMGMVASVERLAECTGAGTGCTACRRRLAALLAETAGSRAGNLTTAAE